MKKISNNFHDSYDNEAYWQSLSPGSSPVALKPLFVTEKGSNFDPNHEQIQACKDKLLDEATVRMDFIEHHTQKKTPLRELNGLYDGWIARTTRDAHNQSYVKHKDYVVTPTDTAPSAAIENTLAKYETDINNPADTKTKIESQTPPKNTPNSNDNLSPVNANLPTHIRVALKDKLRTKVSETLNLEQLSEIWEKKYDAHQICEIIAWRGKNFDRGRAGYTKESHVKRRNFLKSIDDNTVLDMQCDRLLRDVDVYDRRMYIDEHTIALRLDKQDEDKRKNADGTIKLGPVTVERKKWSGY